LHQKIPVIAFERHETFIFESISDAALAYGVNKKIILDRIKDGCTLKDGYTTVDFAFTSDDILDDVPD
jgi:hypothetical protein